MISALSALMVRLKVEARVKELGRVEPSAWSPWLIEPDEGYVELKGLGPIRKHAIEWIEINPLEMKHQGRLVSPKMIDHSTEIQGFLKQQAIQFLRTDDCFFRIANTRR
jgi:hypothetical protein